VTVTVGVGVNCRHHPPAVEFPATDFAELGVAVDAAALLQALGRAMAAHLRQWDRGAGFATIRAGWLARAVGIGHAIRVRLPEREISGHFETIDEAGRLILLLGDGRRETIAAGEVFPIPEGSPPHAPGLTAACRGAPLQR
jgi:BirA family transcriptional regulator, biotin operon repressor / biotin---[acetyl-CoA-carboxylase] ligase